MNILKKRIILFFFIFQLIWPVIHFAADKFLDINRWYFGGLSMYCLPHDKIKLTITINNKPLEEYPFINKSKNIQNAIRRHKHHYDAYGKLLTRSDLVALIQKKFSSNVKVKIVTSRVPHVPIKQYNMY